MPASPGRIVVMGVSGTGKSTIGARLAAELGVAFVDGDTLHPAANVRKMRAGIPLDDADRAPWLARVGELLAGATDLVVACSALRRGYRDAIRASAPDVVFVELDVARDELARRLRARRHHFMPAELLDSQLATLEPLEPDEAGVRVPATGEPAAIAERIRAAVAASRSGAD